MTMPDRLSESGSSSPSTLRLIQRQAIGISIVTVLMTKYAVRPPSACCGGRCLNVQ